MANIAEIAKEVQVRVACKLAGYLGPHEYSELPRDKVELRKANRYGATYEHSQDDLDEMAEAVVSESLEAILKTVVKD